MREIKFRGKCLKSSKIVHGSLLKGVGPKSGRWYILPDVVNLASIPYCHPLDGVEVDPGTVGQYTGFKDADGKEIYEGDILIDELDIASVVYFSESAGSWTTSGNEEIIPKDLFFMLEYNHYVFGNIHETK